MPDYVVLISTLGGIAAFGVNGFILGPVIAALFITIWDIVSASRAEREIDRGLGTESSVPAEYATSEPGKLTTSRPTESE
jgi:predicted PurR-regulated permease PerM